MATSAQVNEKDRTMAGSAVMIVSNIIAGIVLYMGIGWVLSLWLGNQTLLMALGAIVGTVLGLILVFVRLPRDHEANDTHGKQ
jgi:F0F1-type ATP synthase assembly protein I